MRAWNPNACAENKATAALRVWLRVWYHPTVTLTMKHPEYYRLGREYIGRHSHI